MSGTVCVTGASGFIGSWLVLRLLEKGYTVRATVQDPKDEEKVKHLMEFPNAEKQLTLWKADLVDEGSYAEPINGCSGVFHVATPVDFGSNDPEKEVINPAINGMLGIMKACMDSKTVRRLIFTSSAATVNIEENQKPEYDETCWSDTEFILSRKMPGWVYLLSKTLAEKAAWKFAEENKIDLITIIPTLVMGSFISSSMPLSLHVGLSILTGNEALYSTIKQYQYIHVDDLCKAHIFLYEHPDAKGRYICSSNDATIYDLANLLRQKYSHHYNVPSKFNGIEEDLKTVRFSSKKLEELGFQFKYSLEDMYADAIESCQSKGLLSICQSQL